jgi:hypothetical protein
MNDIANASEQTTAMLGANPSKLMKASIAARTLGTSMNAIVSSQRKLLDFSSSMNDELELSALLGKSISLQKSRQLAYDGDIAGAAQATLETVKAAGDFNKMSVYQREALAKASGMELKDLTKMLAVDAQKEEIRLRGTDEQKKQLDLQEAALKTLEDEADLSKQSLLDQNESAIRQQKMQGQMTKLKNIMESLTVSLSDILEPIITALATTIVPIFKVLAAILKVTVIPLMKLMAEPLKLVGELLGGASESINKFGNYMSETSDETKKFFAYFESGLGRVIKVIAGLGAGLLTLAFFGKGGLSGLLKLITKPFTSVASKAGGLLKKIPGVSKLTEKAGDLFGKKGADELTKTADKTKSVKSGTGVKDFLTNLANGLKKMGGAGVAKGAFNLLIASPGLITIIPGAVLAGLIPKKAGDNIESFLTGLASGLKAMGTGKITGGAANLLLASVGLVTIIPGAIVAAVLGVVGKPIETGLKYLAKGIAYMGDTNVFKGALGIAAVGLSIIPFAFAMTMFSNVDWTSVGIGTLALIGFTAAAFGLGAILSSGVGAAIFGAGVIGIAALGVSLIPFAAAALLAGTGVKMLGEGIASSVDPILRLSQIDLTKAALGIGAVGVALTAFGAGSAAAGLGSFVGGLLAGDPIKKMERLGAVGEKLKMTAEAISKISNVMSTFTVVDSFAKSIDTLSNSLSNLNDQVEKISMLKLAAITAIGAVGATASATTTPAATSNLNTSGIEAKLDTLTNLLTGGAVRVYLDGKDVSAAMTGIGR